MFRFCILTLGLVIFSCRPVCNWIRTTTEYDLLWGTDPPTTTRKAKARVANKMTCDDASKKEEEARELMCDAAEMTRDVAELALDVMREAVAAAIKAGRHMDYLRAPTGFQRPLVLRNKTKETYQTIRDKVREALRLSRLQVETGRETSRQGLKESWHTALQIAEAMRRTAEAARQAAEAMYEAAEATINAAQKAYTLANVTSSEGIDLLVKNKTAVTAAGNLTSIKTTTLKSSEKPSTKKKTTRKRTAAKRKQTSKKKTTTKADEDDE